MYVYMYMYTVYACTTCITHVALLATCTCACSPLMHAPIGTNTCRFCIHHTTHLLSSLGFSVEYSLASLIVLHRHGHGKGSVATLVPDGEVNVRMLKKDVRTTRLLARDGHMKSCTTCGILNKRNGVHNT